MTIEMIRTDCMADRTLGMLLVHGRKVCDTLELAIGKGAIPCGRYEVRVTYSPRFKTMLPLVMDVPGRKGIRIHAGNTPKDTSGCILVGERTGKSLMRSQYTLKELLKLLPKDEKMVIDIR